jgi:sulfite reductase alpha subunit-like flavoprotein
MEEGKKSTSDLLGLPRLPKSFIEINYNVEKANARLDEADLTPTKIKQEYSKTRPFFAKVITAKVLTTEDAVKKCLHMELSLENSGFTFEPGDSFGIIPQNRDEDVKFLSNRLSLDLSARFSISCKDKTTGTILDFINDFLKSQSILMLLHLA